MIIHVNHTKYLGYSMCSPSIHWRDWCWSWNSNTLATSCKELTHLKRPWCWERLKAGGEGDDRGWDGWMASLTQWTWVWVNSRSWWWTGRPGVLQSMGSQGVGQDWETELNWTTTIVGINKYRHCKKRSHFKWLKTINFTGPNNRLLPQGRRCKPCTKVTSEANWACLKPLPKTPWSSLTSFLTPD